MASRADIMRLLQRESAEGGAMVGGRRGRGLVGGCCYECMGSGLVGGRIVGFNPKESGLSPAEIARAEREYIAEAKDEPAYQALETAKEKREFVNRYKYRAVGVPYPPLPKKKRTPGVKKPRTEAQIAATQRMRDARALLPPSDAQLLKKWKALVKGNWMCDKYTRGTMPDNMEQRIAEYYDALSR